MKTADARGFTIPELLVVIAVFGVLLGIGTLLLRPVSYANQNNDAERRLGLAILAQSLQDYRKVNSNWPAEIPSTDTPMGSQSGGYNICPELVPAFLKDLPYDPQVGLAYTGDEADPTPSVEACTVKDVKYSTGYSIREDAHAAVTVSSAASSGGRIEITLP
jgi:prepilin-type N-terminal cleavage/methylation domain-containing protein